MFKAITRGARHFVFELLGHDASLFVKLRWLSKKNYLTVLNFHRIDDSRKSTYSAIKPKDFERLISWLVRHFEVIGFGDLPKDRAVKPQIILSFDDGYKDFIENAVPILEAHRIGANQNIIPFCVDSGLPPMNVVLQDFIGQAPDTLLAEISFPGLPNGVNLNNRFDSGLRVSAAFKNRTIAAQRALFGDLTKDFERFDNFSPTPLMTADEIAQLGDAYEIGSHSFEHATMAFESSQYVENDAALCRRWHCQRLGKASDIYAFPNGSVGAGHVGLVKRAGFRHVLLVGNGFSTLDGSVHERINVYGRRGAELRFRATGGFRRDRLKAADDD